MKSTKMWFSILSYIHLEYRKQHTVYHFNLLTTYKSDTIYYFNLLNLYKSDTIYHFTFLSYIVTNYKQYKNYKLIIIRLVIIPFSLEPKYLNFSLLFLRKKQQEVDCVIHYDITANGAKEHTFWTGCLS
jgi:hypothetical protein